jgi:large conductance mechanosensitive channel
MAPLDRLNSLEPTKKALSLFEEFKQFAFKGNVIDMAVGVVIGTAFAKIVDSLVKAVIMPTIALILPSNQSYTTWVWAYHGKTVPYGLFLGEVVNFLIIALALYLFVVKFLGWLVRYKREEVAKPPAKEEQLLTEIRDLLKQRPGP